MVKRILKVITATVFACSFVLVPIVVQANSQTPMIFSNGSFEELDSDGIPTGWAEHSWLVDTIPASASTTFTVMNDGNGKDGNNYMKITSLVSDDARLIFSIKVKPTEKYKVTCWAKSENIPADPNKAGANISIWGTNTVISKDIKGDSDWSMLEFYFESTNSDKADLTLGIGSYARDNTGTAYFDDVIVEKVAAFPNDVSIAKITDDTKNPVSTTPAQKSNATIIIVVISAIIVICVVAVIILLYKKKKPDIEMYNTKENLVDESDETDESDESGESKRPKKTKWNDDDDDDDDTSL